MNGLNSISPIDGRYRKTCEPLRAYFSEHALVRYRVLVEIEYFIALCQIPLPPLANLNKNDYEKIRQISGGFSENDAVAVKHIEKTTNHDIKAVEYFVKEAFDKAGYSHYKELVHFGLTSQDVNNTALPLSIRYAMQDVMLPALHELLDMLRKLSNDYLDLPMLARTHGQAASPSTLGKELRVFYERIDYQVKQLGSLPIPAKFGGATGNFNAHYVAYPEVDWLDFAEDFTASLGLARSPVTTQIDHYDKLSALFDCMKRICTIIIDLDRDLWSYISMDYFKQKIKAGEVGSSAMPHKVNPIDFENSEGNAGIAIALFEHLAAKLPISRLQRDLTDSTVMRNIGVAFAHMLIAVKASVRGLNKVLVNKEKIEKDLENNYAVIAEAIQSILRTINYPNPYEALKELTRTNKAITKAGIIQFIDGLNIPETEKDRLRQITPFNYTGIIPKKLE